MKKSKITVLILASIYALLVLACFLWPKEEYSFSERRKLAEPPIFTVESILKGSYMQQAERYVTDHFPFRDKWRSLKANVSLSVLQKSDINGIYEKDDYLCAMEYPMDEISVKRAGELFEGIYQKYLMDTQANVYLSVIPDKSCFLAEDKYLSMDYGYFMESVYAQTEFAKSIPIHEMLKLSDYYRTDTHWRQEEITDVAGHLARVMGTELKQEYRVETLSVPFYGVYYGQAALSIEPDVISYCTNRVLEECNVFDYENDREIPLYDLSKAEGRDPYEMFLGGNISLVTIDNSNAGTDKELVVFGDSFARSLLPLMAEGYAKITLVDIRYLPSAYIGSYITFTNQDVLFLYSTSVLNNSITLK